MEDCLFTIPGVSEEMEIPRPNLAVGDTVLEINKGFGRGVWSIGHVVRVFPGPDGCVQAVDVQLPGEDISVKSA
jgi:hypothetical protein